MRKLIRVLAATTALTAAFPAFAQDAQADGAEAENGDIIVTARRSDERLQDVPVSVQVVSGESLQKLAITSADELSKLAPGLTLVNSGASTQVSIRGVAWRPGSGTPATPIYFNEVPFDPSSTIQSIFDIGQIEVLRGPQGTSRGAPSISGAVTITTRKPDLDEIGGYVQGFYGTANHWDVQAAVNFPIIKDVMAIRLATNIENSEADRVYSVRSAVKPSIKDRSFRATVLLKPTDTLELQAMYQRRKTDRRTYTQVQGTGSPGAAASPLAGFGLGLGAIPANFNGPALTLAQRASVQDAPSFDPQHVDLLTVNASWKVLGQQLSYNFGRQFSRGGASFATADPLNMLPGFEPYTSPRNVGLPRFRTHEIRLSSTPDSGLPFDYDIGWFSKHSGGTINFSAPVFLAGAFGGPTALPGAVTTPNSAYVLNSSTDISLGQAFDSFYGNLKFKIDDKTELSGGVAFVRDRVPVNLNVQTFAALSSAGPFPVLQGAFADPASPFFVGNPLSPFFGFPVPTDCPTVGAYFGQNFITSTNYPGTCDAVVPAGVGNSVQTNNDKYTATLYNFSLSHKFSDSVMVYATTGSSFRTGLPAINNTGLPANLVTPLPEKAKSYEIGIKTSWGRRLFINAALFQIDYNNQLTTFEGVNYWNTVASRVATTSLAFYRNVNSRVRGFELEIAAKPTDNLSLGANLSYSQIKSRGGRVPCNDPTQPAISAANPINFCPSPVGQVLNQDAPFNATLNGAYTHPLGSLEGYFRFNLNIKGNNPNFGNFPTAGVFKPTPSYAILDLFAGVTGQEGVWELGVFAKNVTNKQVELSRVATLNNVYSPYAIAPSGYNTVRTSVPREFGVSLRYAFGSR